MKGTPYLNLDPFCRFIGPRNWGEALIDDKLTTCLLDNGSQLNFVTPTYARERGMDILSLDTLAREIGGQLPPIAVMGGGMIKPEGFVIMNVQVPCVKGYNEDQIAIVLEDPEMKDCPVVLGTPTLFRVMEVIKESEISELAVPWANSRLSWLMRGVHAKMSQLQVANNFLLVFAVSGPFTSFLVLHTISWFSRSEVCAFVWGIFVRGLRVETFVRVLRSSELYLNNCK